MSYKNPTIQTISEPKGIDIIIQDIQTNLTVLSWLDKSFGRAWIFEEKDITGKVCKVPKCYIGAKEYINVLPNDNLKAQSFIAVRGQEKYIDFDPQKNGQFKSRELSIIFWVNLKAINPAKDYIFTEELKRDVEIVLTNITSISSINAYYDERADQVFADYTLNNVDTQYFMFPYAGMRFDLTVKYFDSLC